MRSGLPAAVIGGAALMITTAGAALAGHSSFRDGPFGVHENGIHFVADAGVTTGCGDGSRYCPGDPVSRGQMATFMHRLSGNAESVPPSVNAATLDGLDSSSLQRRMRVGFRSEQIDPFGEGLVYCPDGGVVLNGSYTLSVTRENTAAGVPVVVVDQAGYDPDVGSGLYRVVVLRPDGSAWPHGGSVTVTCGPASLLPTAP